jgi:NAD-dependent SIR2 family protein deacetylase
VQHTELEQISELNKGVAPNCQHCKDAYPSFCHCTARTCTKCGESGGHLVDTIVNFGEKLHQNVHNRAMAMADKAALCIVLGSSAQVQPACQIPEMVRCSVVWFRLLEDDTVLILC